MKFKAIDMTQLKFYKQLKLEWHLQILNLFLSLVYKMQKNEFQEILCEV